MRRILFTLLASIAMLAFGSASALAKSDHGRHHRGRRHHGLVRHERFGSSSSGQHGAPPSGQQPAPVSTPSAADTAGTVDSFANGVLTIKLTGGSLVGGMVTNATEIKCSMAQQPGTMQTSERGDGGGDNSPGDHGGGQNGGGDDQQTCMSTALVPGATVGEAELGISSSGAVWDKVELIPAQMAGRDS